MADKSLMEEMLPMKISNWESIEYSEGLNCPNENCDNKSHVAVTRKQYFMLQENTTKI